MTYKLIEYSIEEIAEIVGGGTPSSKVEDYYGGSVPWITPKDLSGYNDVYISKGSRNITELGLSKSSAKMLPENAVLFTSRAPIGYVALAENPVCTNQGFKSLIPKEDILDYKFAYYLMKFYAPQIEASASGTTFKEISGGALKSFKMKIPESVEAQKNIADILFKLDSKISNNTAMNATLEKIAQRIFKSWFVDFDPVKANAEGVPFNGLSPEIQALFPNELEESELGMIPKGWDVTNLGSVSECLDSKRIPLSKIKREQKPGIYPYYGATSLMGFIDEWIFDDIYLLLGEDGSVIKDDKTPFTQYIWGKTWVNNHAHVLKGANGISTEQLMIHVQRTNVSEFITGAVQLKINQSNMKRIPFIKASDNINEAFQRIISPLYEKIRLVKDQNDGLIKIRDKLLPRLISGKITIQKTEELLEEAS